MDPTTAFLVRAGALDMLLDIVRVSSTLSIIGVLVVLVYMYKHWKEVSGSPQRILFWITMADLLSPLASIFTRSPMSDTGACQVQGFLLEFAHVSSVFWGAIHAASVFLFVFYQFNAARLFRMEPLLHLIAWGMPIVLTVIPMGLAAQTGVPLFGDAQLYCGMRREYGAYRLVYYYDFVIATLALSLLVYIAVGVRVWQQTADQSVKAAANQQINVRHRFAARTTLYYASFFLTWVFPLTNRMRTVLDPTATPLVWLFVLNAVFKPAHGAMNAVAYFAPLLYSKYFARLHTSSAGGATSSARGTKVLPSKSVQPISVTAASANLVELQRQTPC
ncbi:hypothetical protein RI367_007086 [Sorochytrium milnesiophthora]